MNHAARACSTRAGLARSPALRRADCRIVALTVAPWRCRQAAARGTACAARERSEGEPATSGDPFALKELLEEVVGADARAQLGQRGEALVVGQFALLGALALPGDPLHSVLDILGVLAIVSGVGLGGWALQSLGRSLSPLPAPRANHELVTSGVYAMCRHPMYASLILVSLGAAAVTHSETRLVVAAALWWVLEQKVAFEEAALVKRYPGDYESYRAACAKFLPWLY